jgi:F-type H+-transporting ATPase subunit b
MQIAAVHMLFASSSGSFLVLPGAGLTVWTIVVFLISMGILAKWVFPPIRDGIDRRVSAINESIDTAERTRQDADKLLADYRERLKEARAQAEEIVARARQVAEDHQREAQAQAKAQRDQLMEQTRRDIEAETRRAIQEIRREVADLTVMATEKVTRKVLTEEDQRRLIEEAMSELDFSALSGAEGTHR